jgi:hypothetical protein
MLNVVSVQGEHRPAGELREVCEAIRRRHDLPGETRIQLVQQGQTARAPGGFKIGFHGDLGQFALPRRLEKRTARRVKGIDPPDAKS